MTWQSVGTTQFQDISSRALRGNVQRTRKDGGKKQECLSPSFDPGIPKPSFSKPRVSSNSYVDYKSKSQQQRLCTIPYNQIAKGKRDLVIQRAIYRLQFQASSDQKRPNKRYPQNPANGNDTKSKKNTRWVCVVMVESPTACAWKDAGTWKSSGAWSMAPHRHPRPLGSELRA